MEWRQIENEREKYMAYLCSREWAEKREAVRGRANGLCERCRSFPMDACHHLTYARKYAEELSDLQAICEPCHDYIHGKSDFDPLHFAAGRKEIRIEAEGVDTAVEISAAVHQLAMAKDVLRRTKDAISTDNPLMLGLESGLPDLDFYLGGLRPGAVTVIAGRPSMGKTALALNIVEHIAVKGRTPTLLFSLEMSLTEIVVRLVSSASRVSAHRMMHKTCSRDDADRIASHVGAIDQAPLWIDEGSSRTIKEIASLVRQKRREHELGLAVVDCIQLIQSSNHPFSRQDQLADISLHLKTMARENDIHVICLSQLNRQPETEKDNRPKISQLRGSGGIEENADAVLFVHRPDYYRREPDAREPFPAEIIVGKNRNGPVGSIDVQWLPTFMRFDPAPPERLQVFDDYQSKF
jgi:replicative DNA helicase